MKLTIIFISAILIFSACKQSDYSATDHPDFQKNVLPQAQRLIDSNKIVQGLSYLDSSFQKLNNPGYGDILAVYNVKTKTLFNNNADEADLINAMKYADSAISLINNHQLKNKYRQQYISLIFHRGDMLVNKDRFDDAYASYYKAKQILDSAGMSCEQADYYARLGLIYYKQGKFYNAASLFKQSFENGKKCPETFLAFVQNQGSLDNAGLSFLKLKMLDSAMLYFKKAQIYVNQRSARYADKKIFLAEAHGVILQNIGDTYYEQSDFKQAEALYIQSIETSKRDYRINPIAMQSEIRLARLYIETGKLKAGRQHLQNAEIMLQNNVLDPMSVDKGNFFLSKTKLNYFIRLGLQDSIKIQSKIFLKIQEKITAKEKLLFDADPGKKIFDLQKDYELDILKKQSQLNRLYLIISIILLAAAPVIVYLMYRYSQRSKQLNKKLNDLNRQVSEQNLNLQNALDVLEQSQIRHLEVQNVVMHDLRSPITGIALLTEFLLDSENLNEDEKQMVQLIKDSSEDSLKFVNDLLNEGSARMEMDKELVDLEKLLKYCVNLLQYKALEKNQKIILNSQPVQFMLNREKIYRVISNLITNAIKFSPPETEIKVSLKLLDEIAMISIQDTGIGMPEEIKNNIFSLQENVKREGTEGEKSYGIGLITSKKIIEAHAGKLWFESTVHKGSTFFVELPIICNVATAK